MDTHIFLLDIFIISLTTNTEGLKTIEYAVLKESLMAD